MKTLTDEKLTIVGAAGMIGSNMAQTAIMMGLTSNICLTTLTHRVWRELPRNYSIVVSRV